MRCYECNETVDETFYTFVDIPDERICSDCVETAGKRAGILADLLDQNGNTYCVLLDEDCDIVDVMTDDDIPTLLVRAGLVRSDSVYDYYYGIAENERLTRHGL